MRVEGDHMFRRAPACLSVLVAASLSLSGCATLGAGNNSSGAAPDSADTTPTGEGQSSEVLEVEAESSGPTNAECLVGDWIVTESELQGFYDTVNVSQATFSIAGDMRLAFTDDTYQFLPDFALTLEISGIDAVGEIVGDVNGSYTADEETLSTAYEDSDNVEFVITVMGQEFDGKEMGDTFLAMFAINDAPYTCEADSLTVGYQNVDGEPVVPVEFARAS